MSALHPATRTLAPKLALCLAVIGASAFLFYHQRLFMPGVLAVRGANDLGGGYAFGNDFYQVWLSCRELQREKLNPYSPRLTREIQTGLYGRPLDPDRASDPADQRGFPYPLYTDLLFWPAASFPFQVVRVIVVCTLILVLLTTVLTWVRVLEWPLASLYIVSIVVLSFCSYSGMEALFAAQPGVLVAFLLAGSVSALQRGRFFFSGFLLALSTIKPQVSVLIILYFLLFTISQWPQRRAFWVGFFSTMVLLIGASLLVLPHWISAWIHTLFEYHHYTRPPLVTEVLTSSFGSRFSGPATLVLTALSIVVAIALAWRNRAAAEHSFIFWLTLTTLLAITAIFILPGQAVYDHLILIPAILFLIRNRRPLLDSKPASRVLCAVGLLVLIWPWLSAFAFLALRWLLPGGVFNSTWFFTLPIRATASLPFAVLALLAWLWKLNSAKQPELA